MGRGAGRPVLPTRCAETAGRPADIAALPESGAAGRQTAAPPTRSSSPSRWSTTASWSPWCPRVPWSPRSPQHSWDTGHLAGTRHRPQPPRNTAFTYTDTGGRGRYRTADHWCVNLSLTVHHVSHDAIASWNAQFRDWFVSTLSTDCRAVFAGLGTLLAQRGFGLGVGDPPPNPRPGRRIHRLGPRAKCGHAFDNEKAAMRYQHACERFSGVSDERPAPRPRCAAGTGGSRADRRTTRPACRSARRQCPSVHPAAQWCALRRRPTHGRR